MDDDVLEACGRLLDELEIQPDAPCLRVAGTPLGLHPLDSPFAYLDAQAGLPFREHVCREITEPLAVPTLKQSLAVFDRPPADDGEITFAGRHGHGYAMIVDGRLNPTSFDGEIDRQVRRGLDEPAVSSLDADAPVDRWTSAGSSV